LKETNVAKLAPKHAVRSLGWAGRMNGPIDHPMSSCMSCHQTAQVVSDCGSGLKKEELDLSPMIPTEGGGGFFARPVSKEERMPWMVTLRGGTFVEGKDDKGEPAPNWAASKFSQGFDEARFSGMRSDAEKKNDKARAEKL